MILEWKPFWYELDQTIVVGDIDYFYLKQGENTQAFGYFADDDEQVKAEILTIRHPVLGAVRGILANDLYYTLYLVDGRKYFVNAESKPGTVYESTTLLESEIIITDWRLDVEVTILERTGQTWSDLRGAGRYANFHLVALAENEKYRRLLGVETL
jgi:hypothetical protein